MNHIYHAYRNFLAVIFLIWSIITKVWVTSHHFTTERLHPNFLKSMWLYVKVNVIETWMKLQRLVVSSIKPSLKEINTFQY